MTVTLYFLIKHPVYLELETESNVTVINFINKSIKLFDPKPPVGFHLHSIF